MDLRIGLGHDTHRLIAGTHLFLGGVRIEHDRALFGHSDADVLLHAITDSLLGAAGLGDIGEMFPDTDPCNCGRDSAAMLQSAWRRVREDGWGIVNLDMIVCAERPKLAAYKDRIRERIGQILEIPPSRIGLKAKTGEKVGPIGREEAISAECVALCEKSY